MTGMHRFTKEELDSFSYTATELRRLAREHRVTVPGRALHHELVAALTAAGVKLPPKRR